MVRDNRYRPPVGFVSKTGKSITQAGSKKATVSTSSSKPAGAHNKLTKYEQRAQSRQAKSESESVSRRNVEQSSRRKSTARTLEISKNSMARVHSTAQHRVITFSIIGLILVAAIAVAVYVSPLFTIEQVKVNGLTHLNQQYVLDQAAVSADSTVLRNDAAGITNRLKQNRYVAEVKVSTELPNLLIIDVTERTLAAKAELMVDVADGSIATWLVSSDSIWLDDVNLLDSEMVVISHEQLLDLPTIRDVNKTVQSAQSLSISDQGLLNAIAVLRLFTTGMRTNVKTISAPDVYNCTLTLKNNVLVSFGEAIDVPAKEKAIETALSQNSQLSSINVHVPRLTAVL